MNLATRCPRCATAFRVQDAQLAASDGHVRCGRCDTVFDARLSLFDLDTGEALLASPPPAPAHAAAGFEAVEPEAAPWSPATAEPPEAAPGPASAFAVPANAEPASSATTEVDDRQEPGWDDTRWEPDPRALEPEWNAAAASAAPAPPPVPTTSAEINQRMQAMLGGADTPPSPPPPSPTGAGNLDAWRSLQDTDAPGGQAVKWQRGAVWVLVALLALVLPLQWAWVERAALRAKSPAFDALMARLCPNCANPPWQHLEGLSVDASSLQPTPQGGAFQVSLTVRNRAPHTLALPWVELRLSDGSGRPVLRRAIRPTEIGASSDRLVGGGSVQLSGTFKLPPESRVSGYEISLFHP